MRNIVLLVLILLVAAALGYVWWRYAPARDGAYVVANDRIAWHMDVSNGVLRTRRIENLESGTAIDITDDSSDFVLRVGPASSVGWVTVKRPGRKDTFVHSVRNGWTVDPGSCRVRWFVRGHGSRTFILQHTNQPLTVRLVFSYERGQPWLRRQITLQTEPLEELAVDRADHVRWGVNGTPTHGGRGQPVFVNDDFFCALEHPNSSNLAEDARLTLRQYPGYSFSDQPLALQRMVVGGGQPGAARDEFNRYVASIRRTPRSLSLFNTWCHMREGQLTAANIIKTADELVAKLQPYGASLDAFVIDDGWQNKQSVWESRSDRFPQGLGPVFTALRERGYRPGLWLALSGVMLDIDWCEQQGYETAADSHLCLSGTNYQRALRRRLDDIMTTATPDFFKHDFNYFNCSRIQHGHYSTEMQSSEANVDELFDLLAFETQRNHTVELAVTTGTWPSPWWLPHCDIIWMGGKDHDFDTTLPASRGSAFEMNYRDGALYRLLVEQKLCFPLSALMTHGIVDARHNVYQMNTEDDEGWSTYLMNYLGRGSFLREFYISPELLSPRRWEMLARALRWAKSCDPCMRDAHFILGDPRKGELFGYAGADGFHSYCSLRNPGFVSAAVPFERALQPGDLCQVVYPWHETLRWQPDTTLDLPPEQVVIAESIPLQQLDIPVVVGARARLVRSEAGQTEYELALSGLDQRLEVVAPVNIEGIEGDIVSAAKTDDTRWRVDVRGESAPVECADVLQISAHDGRTLNASIGVRPACRATMRILWRNIGNATPRLTLNGRPVSAPLNRGTGWQLLSLPLQPGTNIIGANVRSSDPGLTNIIVQAFLEEEAPLSTRRVIVRHDSVSPRDIYTRPLPLLQTVARRGREILPAQRMTRYSRAQLPPRERLLKAADLTRVRSAVLKLDVFDVNGGMYNEKRMFLNGVFIGRIPANPEPLSQWHSCSIALPDEAVKKLALDNVFTLRDETGDAYKIRIRQLEVVLADGRTIATPDDMLVKSSSLQWPFAEGEELQKNGKEETVLSF